MLRFCLGRIGLFNIRFDEIQVEGSGSTNQPVATSFIPTTTASLTRAGDVLTYLTAGNRKANEETILIKFIPLGGSFANDGIERNVFSSPTVGGYKNRALRKYTSGTKATMYPNLTDSASVSCSTSPVPTINESLVAGCVVKHTSPYIIVYSNGGSPTTYTTGDWIDPVFSSVFNIAMGSASDKQLNGIIQKVAIFNRALTANEVACATAEMNR